MEVNLYLVPALSICRPVDPTVILNIYSCIFRMISGSAGRQINRVGAKYRSESIYIIYDKPCMYIQDERYVGRSAGRQVGT